MPRDGAIVLSDLHAPFLHVVCEPCGRRGSYGVARLMAKHGDAKLTDLLPVLANCSRTTNGSIYDHCKAGFEASIPRYRPLSPTDRAGLCFFGARNRHLPGRSCPPCFPPLASLIASHGSVRQRAYCLNSI